jgi:4-hydroxy-2-oxoheptanedioate aldolase
VPGPFEALEGIDVRESKICKKLSRNEPVLITVLHVMDAMLYEMASLMGFDGLWIDLEHHAHSLQTAQAMMRGARVGTSDIVARPAKGEFMRMGRILEAGAQGILYPRCDNAQEAAELVKWAKFPPQGSRGYDGSGADNPFCFAPPLEYSQFANRNTFIAAQIEDPAALDHVDEIASVEGIDVIFLGPADFSAMSGYMGQMDHQVVRDAERRIAEACRKHGKHWGRPAGSPDEAQRLVDMGARFLAHGADMLLVKLGWERMQREFAAAGFQFENRLIPGDSQEVAPGAPHYLAPTAQRVQ